MFCCFPSFWGNNPNSAAAITLLASECKAQHTPNYKKLPVGAKDVAVKHLLSSLVVLDRLCLLASCWLYPCNKEWTQRQGKAFCSSTVREMWEPAVPRACKAGIIRALGFDGFASLSQDFSNKDATMQLPFSFCLLFGEGSKLAFCGFEHVRYSLKVPVQGCIWIPLGTDVDFSGVSLSSLLHNKWTPKFVVDGINNSPASSA